VTVARRTGSVGLMNQSDWNRVSAMLIDSATALLEAFGAPVRYDPAGEASHPPKDGLLAIIGFAGTQMRGSLVLSANRGLLERSRPVAAVRVTPSVPGSAPGPAPSPPAVDALQDWIGELANQLLGRLKSRFLAHGVAIQLGTPTTVSGLELRARSGSGGPQATPLWLLSGDDWLVVRLDAIASPDAELSTSADPSSAAAEGEVLLF
jgi:CheY-specific phosphatase CheX